MPQIIVEGIPVTITRKKIRSVYLRVKAESGEVRLSVPMRLSNQEIIRFLTEHMEWIREKRSLTEPMETLHYVTGDQIWLFGVPNTLLVREGKTKRVCGIYQEDRQLILTAMPDSTEEERKKLLEKWQRKQLQDTASILLHKWSRLIGVQVKEWHIRKMHTRWGTCNIQKHRIWLSFMLTEQPLECVEYVVVHELCHLHVPDHSPAFWQEVERYLPDWRTRKAKLNEKRPTN